MKCSVVCVILILVFAASLHAQSTPPATTPPATTSPEQSAAPYKPKYRTDPARSDSEFEALAYMRVVMRAESGFNKQYGHYATSLAELVHSGTFTKRMVDPHRGDYTVTYNGKRNSYVLMMTPQTPDATHRSFYAEDDGKIHADDAKPADASSPVIETHHFAK